MADPLTWATLVIGSTGAVGAIVALRKAPAETRKLDTDSATQIAAAGVQMGTDAVTQLRELRTEVNGLMDRERQRDRMAARHERWDLEMVDRLERAVPGLKIPVAPPLYLDSQTTG